MTYPAAHPYPEAPRTRTPGVVAYVAWGGRQVLIGILLTIVIFVFLAFIVLLALALAGMEVEGVTAAGLAINGTLYCALIAVPFFVAGRSSRRPAQALGFRPIRLDQSWHIPVGLFTVYAVLILSTALLGSLGIEELEPEGNVPKEVFEDRATVIAAFIVVGLIAPVAEEVFFRGFVFAGLARSFGVIPAMVLSSLLFGAAHQSLGLIIPFALVGVVLAGIYMRTGTLWANVGVHGAFNLVSLVVGTASS